MIDGVTGMRYLVTGASGFIGRAACRALVGFGAEVVGVSRRPPGFETTGWMHRQVDLSEPGQVDTLFEEARPDYVLHLASCVTGRRDVEWVRETLSGNLVSAVNVLVAAQRHAVGKTVLAGSLEEPAATDGAPVPASPYAAAKWCATTYARMFHALYDTGVVVARIFMVYGPQQPDATKLVPYVCLTALAGERPQLMSGERPVDWIYVDDVVRGLIALTVAGPRDGSHVDIGTGRLVTTGEVAHMLCELAGTGVVPEIGALPDRPMEQVRVADPARTGRLLDWQPEVTLRDGLHRTLEWYRAYREATSDDEQASDAGAPTVAQEDRGE
jgi:nucleoside-diphosphate-sugar epimerase